MKTRSLMVAAALVWGCSAESTTPTPTDDVPVIDVPGDMVRADNGGQDVARADASDATSADASDAVSADAVSADAVDAATEDAVSTDTVTVDTVTTDTVTVDTVVEPDVVVTPDVVTPDVVTPDVVTPDVVTPDVVEPDVIDASTPDVVTPDVVTPDVVDVVTTDVVDVVLTDATTDATTDASDAAVCVPAAEICNGVDDDCDRIIDENGCADHLLISEIVAQPSEAESIEIYNPTSSAIDLSNVYLTDTNLFPCYLGRACTVAGVAPGAFASADFVARFPAGAAIGAGQFLVIGISHPADYQTLHAMRCPDFYLPRSSVRTGTCTAALAMRATGFSTSIGSSAGLTNDGEPIVLFQWDGTSNRPQDIDYVYFGPSGSNAALDRSTIVFDTVDGGMGTMFFADTAAASQSRAPVHTSGGAVVRCNFAETGERRTGGNGIGGHDETSEPNATNFRITPGITPVGDAGLTMINDTPGAMNACR